MKQVTKELKKLRNSYRKEAAERRGYLDRDEVSRSERGEVEMAAMYCEQFVANLGSILKLCSAVCPEVSSGDAKLLDNP